MDRNFEINRKYNYMVTFFKKKVLASTLTLLAINVHAECATTIDDRPEDLIEVENVLFDQNYDKLTELDSFESMNVALLSEPLKATNLAEFDHCELVYYETDMSGNGIKQMVLFKTKDQQWLSILITGVIFKDNFKILKINANTSLLEAGKIIF